MNIMLVRVGSDTTVSSSIDFFWGGGFLPPAEGFTPTGGRNLDFCRCTIPTIGLNGKLGESLPHIIGTSQRCRRRPPLPSVALHRLHRLHRRKSPQLSPRLQSACFRRRLPHRCRRRHTATVALHRRRYRCQSPLPPQRAVCAAATEAEAAAAAYWKL